MEVRFFCAICGDRYWEVADDCENPLRTAIEEEAAWHDANMRHDGNLLPVSITPIWGITNYG